MICFRGQINCLKAAVLHISIKRDCRKVKIVLEHSLGYFNIKGLAENDLFAEQLSEELVNIGTSMK